MNRRTVSLLLVLLAGVAAALFLSSFSQKEATEEASESPVHSPTSTEAVVAEDPIKPPSTESASVLDSENFIPPDDPIFVSVDESLVDDSIIQSKLAGRPINRYRVVDINEGVLRAHMRGQGAEQDLYLPLFDDLTVMGRPEKTREYHRGERIGISAWSGTVNGDGKSLMVIVISPEGKTSVDIISDEGIYQVTALEGTPYHVVIDSHAKMSFAGDTVPN